MPELSCPHLDPRQGDLCPRHSFQEAHPRGPLGRPPGLPLIQAGQRRASPRQAMPDLGFNQRQQARQPDDLIVTANVERADAQGTVFDQVKVPLQAPAAAIVDDRLGQRHLLPRQIGNLDTPAQAMPPPLDGRFVVIHAGDHVPYIHPRLSRAVGTAPPPSHIARDGVFLPLPVHPQHPYHVVSFQHLRHGGTQGRFIAILPLSPPPRGVRARTAASALAKRWASWLAWWAANAWRRTPYPPSTQATG